MPGLVRVPLVALLALAGCSRQAYRERTDAEVETIISRKNVFPEWGVKAWHVYPDGRARFADPSCPDFPPYPPDDYAAKLLSPNPQRPGRGGVGRFEGDGYLKKIQEWDALNRAADPAPQPAPDAPKPDPIDKDETARALSSDEKAFKLKLEQTLELGLFNSREFQDRREDLYLAALPVSLQRFQFSAQAFLTEELIRTSAGPDAGTGSNTANNFNVGFSQRFATGATLLVSLANSIVVNMANGQTTVGVGTAGLTLAQPLLRGAGVAVNLEPLTQAERNVVYAIRSYSRFRALFYYALAGGGGYTNNPYGLQGLAANLGRGVGANLTANPAGYLPVLLRAAVLANEQGNIATVEQFLRLFQNLKEGGGVTDLQVSRVEQRLLQSRAIVLQRAQQYVDSIDNFKLQLGVPATLPLELDDGPIRPIREQLKRFERVYDQLQEVEKASATFDPNEPAGAYRDRWRRLLTDSPLARGTALAAGWPKIADTLKALPDDVLRQRTAEARETRRKLQDARAARQNRGEAESPADERTLALNEEEIDRLDFERALRTYEARPWLRLPPDRQAGERGVAFRAAADAGLLLAIVARNQRLSEVRKAWPDAAGVVVEGSDLLRVPLEEAYVKVAEVSLRNRLDLMNTRGQVVDAWRQLTVQANALRGVLDVGAASTTGTNADSASGLNFNPRTVLNTVRLRIEPPFVRRAERNAYRASLISYQRQRRNLMAFEDNIVTDSRTDLRTVRQLYRVYLVQQRAVELAYSQVDNARSTFLAPPDPKAPDTAGTVAALTQQLLEAQAAVVQAQNDLYTAWLTYQTARMELYLDLELLSPDDRGNWTDDSCGIPPPAARPGRPRPARAAARPPAPRRRRPRPVPAPRPAQAGRLPVGAGGEPSWRAARRQPAVSRPPPHNLLSEAGDCFPIPKGSQPLAGGRRPPERRSEKTNDPGGVAAWSAVVLRPLRGRGSWDVATCPGVCDPRLMAATPSGGQDQDTAG